MMKRIFDWQVLPDIDQVEGKSASAKKLFTKTKRTIVKLGEMISEKRYSTVKELCALEFAIECVAEVGCIYAKYSSTKTSGNVEMHPQGGASEKSNHAEREWFGGGNR